MYVYIYTYVNIYLYQKPIKPRDWHEQEDDRGVVRLEDGSRSFHASLTGPSQSSWVPQRSPGKLHQHEVASLWQARRVLSQDWEGRCGMSRTDDCKEKGSHGIEPKGSCQHRSVEGIPWCAGWLLLRIPRPGSSRLNTIPLDQPRCFDWRLWAKPRSVRWTSNAKAAGPNAVRMLEKNIYIYIIYIYVYVCILYLYIQYILCIYHISTQLLALFWILLNYQCFRSPCEWNTPFWDRLLTDFFSLRTERKSRVDSIVSITKALLQRVCEKKPATQCMVYLPTFRAV